MSTNYQSYLQSSDWKAKRLAAITRYGGRCYRCGQAVHSPLQNLEVHHLSYHQDLRLVPLSELKPLCHKCHSRFHSTAEQFLNKWVTGVKVPKLSFHRLSTDYGLLPVGERAKVLIALQALKHGALEHTPYWRAIALHVKVQAGWKCSKCSATGAYYTVRHLSYSNYGAELEHLGELTCLCEACNHV